VDEQISAFSSLPALELTGHAIAYKDFDGRLAWKASASLLAVYFADR
jgi:hypothetical protein